MSRTRDRAVFLMALAVAGCAETGPTAGRLDFDLRDRLGSAFDTSPNGAVAVAARPEPDARGIISYPGYQVAVARRGDTVRDVAARIGLPAEELARHNGAPVDVALRRGEVLALPRRVTEPARTAAIAAPGAVTTTTLENRTAGAIDRAQRGRTVAPEPAAAPKAGPEPERHRVTRGETAFSIARRYGVPVRALGEWNGLDADYTIRVGQVLLIPPRTSAAAAPGGTSAPGAGTTAPPPPSAATPLPRENETQAPPEATPPSPDLSEDRTEASVDGGGRLAQPVTGPIIRPFNKGTNDGIDIAAPAGSPVRAAEDGVVAAITRDTDQVPILVLRHPGNILTVYAGVEDIAVEKDDTVARGQTIAAVRDTASPFLHFEVREGFDSVDPVEYLQ